MSTAIVAGAVANKPFNGGAAWSRMSWALGLRRLGFDVYFVEQIEPETCVDAHGALAAFEKSANMAFFDQVMREFRLSGSASLLYAEGERVHGLGYEELLDVAETADLLINITGHLRLEEVKKRPRRKVYVDLDPGFTQLWEATGTGGAGLDGHDLYFTVGQNVGTPDCPVPTDRIRWRPIAPPVVLDEWPVIEDGGLDRFTTVASWRGPYGPVECGGRIYGLKAHEFRKFMDLPARARQTFEIALDIHPADRRDLDALRRNGWRVADPRSVAADPAAFRSYVQGSGAEFSVAQGIYVETACGWFSDRTARYLASGKPVLVQDTGFSHTYPVGEGVIAFRTLEEAVAGAADITEDYERHRRRARDFAQEYLDSDKVLGRLLEEVGVAP